MLRSQKNIGVGRGKCILYFLLELMLFIVKRNPLNSITKVCEKSRSPQVPEKVTSYMNNFRLATTRLLKAYKRKDAKEKDTDSVSK